MTGRGDILTVDLTGRIVTSSHPSSLTYNLTSMGFEEGELVEAGLTVDSQSNYGRGDNLTGDLTGARYRYYDRFRGRLMVPIRNEQGVVVAFGGRALDMSSQIPSQASQVPSQTIDESALSVLAASSVSGRVRVTQTVGSGTGAASTIASTGAGGSYGSTPAKYLNSPESDLFKKVLGLTLDT